MRTYLVTGGAGFIGSNYIHYMFRKYGDEIQIINVDKLTYAGNLENLKSIESRGNYTFIKADICDSAAIREPCGQKHQGSGGVRENQCAGNPGHAQCGEGGLGAAGWDIPGRQKVPARIHG